MVNPVQDLGICHIQVSCCVVNPVQDLGICQIQVSCCVVNPVKITIHKYPGLIFNLPS